MKKQFSALAAVLAVVFLAGCWNSPSQSGYLDWQKGGRLAGSERFPHSQVFIKEGVNFGTITQWSVDPVEIYIGPDASWKGVDDNTKEEMALFLRSEFARVLKPGSGKPSADGPSAVRLKLTLVDVELTRPMLSASAHVPPFGLTVNGGEGAPAGKGAFIGSITFAMELHDSKTGELLASFITRAAPNALDLSTPFTPIAAAHKAVIESAEKFQATLSKMTTGAK